MLQPNVVQFAFGTDAAATLVNNGTMSFAVSAQAEADDGPANAFALNDGVEQSVTGENGATATYDNEAGGALVVTATADAVSPTVAVADAEVTFAVAQFVTVTGDGDGLALIDNDGLITALASANAVGGTAAFAAAEVEDGLLQIVTVAGEGNAAAQINNQGTVNVSALSDAQAGAGAVAPAPDLENAPEAVATAWVDRGVSQTATANDDPATEDVAALASVDFNNGGTLAITASANADVVADADVGAAQFGNAFATAGVGTAVEQVAIGNDGADADASMNNDGTLTVNAIADASGLDRMHSRSSTTASGRTFSPERSPS